ncbi:MAG: hypothetical protein ABIK83_04275 [Candidatus Zixiibacteriota bacterium]
MPLATGIYDSAGVILGEPSIAIDSEGGLHVVYRYVNIIYGEPSPDAIMYMNNVSGSWSMPQEIVGGLSTPSSDGLSVAVDFAGDWHVVYLTHTLGGGSLWTDHIMYVSSGSGPVSLVTRTYDDSTGTGAHLWEPSIAIDPEGRLHVVYRLDERVSYVTTHTSIMYMNSVSGSWSTPQEIVGGLSLYYEDMGLSLAVGPTGGWHVVYPDGTQGNYIMYTSSSSDPTPIVSGVYLWEPSISMDPRGGLHVVYRDYNRSAIMYTKLEGCGDMQFRPNPDGWQFANWDPNMWPYMWQQGDPTDEQCDTCDVTRCFPSWELFRAAFGTSQTEFPNGKRKLDAEAIWESIKDCWAGSCYGFAITAFLFFDNYLDIPTQFPGDTTVFDVPIGDESRRMIHEYWIYQFGRDQQRHISQNYETTTPNQTLAVCQSMFNSSANPRNDRILVFYNNHGDGAHGVNPYKCEVDASNPEITHVYIYDNNAPNNDTRRISFNTNSNNWSYSAMPAWGGSGKIFLMDPISSYTTYPILPRSIPPKERWISGSSGSYSEYVEFYLQAADSVRLVSSLGEIGRFHDSPFSNLTDGMPIIPITGMETPPIGYFLPNVGWSLRVTGHNDSSFRLSVFADSTVLILERDSVVDSDAESVRYLGNDTSLVVTNKNPGAVSYSVDLINVLADSQIVCGVRRMSVGADDSVQYALTNESGIKIDNYGEASSYSVRIQIAGQSLDTVFYCTGVSIGANTSHSIIPDWRVHNDSLLVIVDQGMSGQATDTLLLGNEGEPPVFVCGDANGSGEVDIDDIMYLVGYVFLGDIPPEPLSKGDMNCSGDVDIDDIMHAVGYVFLGGHLPCDTDGDGMPDC